MRGREWDMNLKNKRLPLEECAKILEVKKKSLRAYLSKGIIPGEKDENGLWFVYLWDILYYKENRGKGGESPQDSLTVTETIKCLGISREEVFNKIRDGSLKAIKTCHTWCIFKSSVLQALEKQAEILKPPDYIEEDLEKIEILSPYGLDTPASIVIIRWLNKYRLHQMHIYKKDEDDHEMHEVKNCLDLLRLNILKNETIELKFSGLLAHVMMKEFKQMNTNLFRSQL